MVMGIIARPFWLSPAISLLPLHLARIDVRLKKQRSSIIAILKAFWTTLLQTNDSYYAKRYYSFRNLISLGFLCFQMNWIMECWVFFFTFPVLEIATGEHAGNLALLETEAKSYAYEMRRIAKSDVHEENSKGNNHHNKPLWIAMQPVSKAITFLKRKDSNETSCRNVSWIYNDHKWCCVYHRCLR